MEGKGSFFILIIIVALLTITLAVLAGYLFLAGGSSKAPTQVSQQQSAAPKVVPTDDKLLKKLLYTDKQYFNLENDDSSKISVISVNVELVYFKTVKGIKNVQTKIDSYDNEIKEKIGTYFQSLTLADVEAPDAKDKAKEVLVKQLNELLLSSEKEKSNPIIYSISFPEWFYQ